MYWFADNYTHNFVVHKFSFLYAYRVFCFKYLYLQIKIQQNCIGTSVDFLNTLLSLSFLLVRCCVFTFANQNNVHHA